MAHKNSGQSADPRGGGTARPWLTTTPGGQTRTQAVGPLQDAHQSPAPPEGGDAESPRLVSDGWWNGSSVTMTLC